MTARPTADIVADLNRFAPLVFWPAGPIPSCGHTNVADTLRDAADRLVELASEVDKRILDRAELWRRHDELRIEATGFRDRLKTSDALRPPCPTCGGKAILWPRSGTGHASAGIPCPDCVDGKVSVEQLAATYRAVHDDAQGTAGDAFNYRYYLRSVKPT